MKMWLSPIQWIGLSICLMAVDVVAVYVFIFYPSLYQVEATNADYRIQELRHLDAGLTLTPLVSPTPIEGLFPQVAHD